jgi:hypothetical protein
LNGDTVEIDTMNRAKLAIPLTHIASLVFRSTDTVFLSDLDPETAQWNSALGSSSVSEELGRLYRPRKDERLLGGKLSVVSETKRGAQKQFEKGLAIHSRTELVYRLAGEYRTFQATAGIDPAFANVGEVQVTFFADGQELRSERVKGTEPARVFDFSVSGVQRLKILVDFGDESDQGDYLNLCDARLTK